MPQNWTSRFSDNIKNYEGYAIGKLFKLLNDPEIISLAGGLPSPDTFLTNDLDTPGLYDMYIEFNNTSLNFTVPLGRFKIQKGY